MPRKQEFEYSLKMINPARLSDFKTVNIHAKAYCESLDVLREFLKKNVSTSVDFTLVDIGYIETGHGAKGRKVWLCDNDDVHKMYLEYKDKSKIMLWCYTGMSSKTGTPKKSSKTEKHRSNYDSQLKTADEVDVIFQSLKSKHGGKYTPEQLRVWAHMLQIGTHDSTEQPPNKPFFCGSQRKRSNKEDECSSSPDPKRVLVSHSPGRRVNMRGELIDQLRKCSDLADSGAISDEVFHDLQETILSDIKNL